MFSFYAAMHLELHSCFVRLFEKINYVWERGKQPINYHFLNTFSWNFKLFLRSANKYFYRLRCLKTNQRKVKLRGIVFVGIIKMDRSS